MPAVGFALDVYGRCRRPQ